MRLYITLIACSHVANASSCIKCLLVSKWLFWSSSCRRLSSRGYRRLSVDSPVLIFFLSWKGILSRAFRFILSLALHGEKDFFWSVDEAEDWISFYLVAENGACVFFFHGHFHMDSSKFGKRREHYRNLYFPKYGLDGFQFHPVCQKEICDWSFVKVVFFGRWIFRVT